MKIGITKETRENETRVAITPDIVQKIIKLGYEVIYSSNAAESANFSDEEYKTAGASIVTEDDIYNSSNIIVKINAPSDEEIAKIKDGTTIISSIWPAQNKDLMEKLSKKNINVLAMDCVPRISRAQKMDTLSSMANVAGYRAIVEASSSFGRFLGGQITAAGKIQPAKVLIIGAGVAGLSAIGAAGSMGAIVRAFDTRPEVREQVESLNAQFLEVQLEEDGSSDSGYAKTMSKEFIEAEMAIFLQQAKEVDIIVTTALIPGKPAPKLITEEMVKAMAKGSVIVDLAAEQGGNCELTQKGKKVVAHGVTIIGYHDLPARLPGQSSRLYASNIAHLLTDMTKNKDGVLNIDFEDEVVRGVTVIKEGKITWPAPAIKVTANTKEEKKEITTKKEEKKGNKICSFIATLLVAGGAIYTGSVVPETFLAHFSIFTLSCFVGYQLIWNVTPALHTPLMSVTNAISGIIVIGGLVQVTSSEILLVALSCGAILLATINIVGGFSVTHKTLKLFSK